MCNENCDHNYYDHNLIKHFYTKIQQHAVIGGESITEVLSVCCGFHKHTKFTVHKYNPHGTHKFERNVSIIFLPLSVFYSKVDLLGERSFLSLRKCTNLKNNIFFLFLYIFTNTSNLLLMKRHIYIIRVVYRKEENFFFVFFYFIF